MRLAILPILPILLAVLDAPVRAQTPPKPAQRPAPAVQGPVSAPVIGCSSLANYRLLRREATGEAAAARLADPKADHLGCAAFPRDRVAALADHVTLAGEAYDCLTLQGTAICHWTHAGIVALPAAAKPQPKPASADRPKR